MAFKSIPVITLCASILIQIIGAATTTTKLAKAVNDASKDSPAAPSPLVMPPSAASLMSPEASTATSQQLNIVGGITDIVADAVKNTIAQQGTSFLKNLGGGTRQQQPIPASFIPPQGFPQPSFNPASAMGGMGGMGGMGSLMGMLNPMSMFGMGMSGGGSPFGMMRPMMMWNMFDNMFEMMSF